MCNFICWLYSNFRVIIEQHSVNLVSNMQENYLLEMVEREREYITTKSLYMHI